MKITYKCEICGETFTWANRLSIHIKQVHNETCKSYYDKFLKTDPKEGYCAGCGKPTEFLKFSHGYNKYCSMKCKDGNIIRTENRRNFYRQKFNDDKIINNTCVPGAVETMWKNYEKRTGYSHNMLNPEVQKNWSDNYFTKTGYKHNFSNPSVIKSRQKLYKEKTGYDNPYQNPEVKENIKKIHLKNLGVEYPAQSKIVYNKMKETFRNHYGVDNPAQSPEIRSKMVSKYYYDKIYFDSSWELGYYIWLKDNNVDFEFHPNKSFNYIFENKQHKYFPDFNINGLIIEIKSDHLLKKMYKENTLDNAKYNCMKENNVVILNSIYIKHVFKYINEKYGRNYLKQYKVNKNEK